MARGPHKVVEEDEEVAATVVMSHLRLQLSDDDLTPRVAPERDAAPDAVLDEEERTRQLVLDPAALDGSLQGRTRDTVAPIPDPPPRAPRRSVKTPAPVADEPTVSPLVMAVSATLAVLGGIAVWALV